MLELYREQLPATRASVGLARHDVRDALTEAGIADAALLADIALLVTEATTNAVRHAYPPGSAGHVDVTVNRTADSIMDSVEDGGVGMNAHEHTDGLGLGLPIMNAQTARLEITSDATGTIVTMHVALPAT